MKKRTQENSKNTSKQAIPNYSTRDDKSRTLGLMKSMTYEGEINTPSTKELCVPETPQRKRTIRKATKLLKEETGLRGKRLDQAIEDIKTALQPTREAKKIIKRYKRNKLNIENAGKIDFSDVQELRVRLFRKMHKLYPSDPQSMLLRRMDRMIAIEEMNKKKFGDMAAAVLSMGVVGLADRKKEAELQGSGNQLPLSMVQSINTEGLGDIQLRLSKAPIWKGWYGDIPDFLDRRPPHKRAKFKELT